MIVREWRGWTRPEHADGYLSLLRDEIAREIGAVEGNRGVQVLQNLQGPLVEFTVLSHWDSMDAVRRFAGPEPEKAVVPERARAYLQKWDETVQHHRIVLGSDDG